MRAVDLIVALALNMLASVPFWASIRQGKLPNTAHFATLGIILYYDVGLILELADSSFKSVFFPSLLDADSGTFLFGIVIIAIAPWLLQAGAHLVNWRLPLQPQDVATRLTESRRWLFYLLASVSSAVLAAYGVLQLFTGEPLWAVRIRVTATLGPMIVILYLPLYFLAFYVRQADSRSFKGLIFSLFLAGMSVLTTLPVGERWVIILPFVVIALFRFRLTLGKIALIGGGVLVAASLMLVVFKFDYSSSDLSLKDLIARTFTGDIFRAGVLRTAIERSPLEGTRVLPYPLAGYVYAGLVYMPRPLVPFKGYSTAVYFTGDEAGTAPEDTNWAYGMSMIEEISLNAGALFILPGLLVYGIAMGLMDKASLRVPALVVPTRLLAVWLAGYDFAPSFVIFGSMGFAALALHFLFTPRAQAINPVVQEEAVGRPIALPARTSVSSWLAPEQLREPDHRP